MLLRMENTNILLPAQLIKDGRKNKILSKKLRSRIKVTMVHGVKDEVVPVSFSRKVLTVFPNAKKKVGRN